MTSNLLELAGRERFDNLEQYARAASIALMKLSGGGSEMFTRIGDEYYAIPKNCVERAEHRIATISPLRARASGPSDE